MYKQIGLAFFLLTLSVTMGFMLTYSTGNQREWLTDPKIMATVVTWVVYAFLLHLRMYAKRHGRRIALAVLAAFICVLFTFFGVHVIARSVSTYQRIFAVAPS